MKPIIKIGIGVFILYIVMLPVLVQSPSEDDVLFQVSTLQALLDANYDGVVTFEEVMANGDFGLGTFDALNGELIVIDGEYYQVKEDGNATLVSPEQTTPFAAVTFFEADQEFVVEDSLTCSDFYARIAEDFPSNEDTIYAMRVEGDFETLQVRAPQPETKPYVPLVEALEDQIVFNYDDVNARLAGLWFPDSIGDLNVAGFHFHGVTEDLKGGHVLDCTVSNVTVQLDQTDELTVQLFAYNEAGSDQE